MRTEYGTKSGEVRDIPGHEAFALVLVAFWAVSCTVYYLVFLIFWDSLLSFFPALPTKEYCEIGFLALALIASFGVGFFLLLDYLKKGKMM